MRIAFAVNHSHEIEASSTTLALARSALARGHELFIFGIGDLAQDSDGKHLAAGHLYSPGDPPPRGHDATHPMSQVALGEFDAIALRTSPGRDAARAGMHSTAMRWFESLRERGVFVFNPPEAVRRAAGKDFLAQLPPSARPAMLVSRKREDIIEFMRSRPGPTVIKPLVGTRGSGVHRVLLEQLEGEPLEATLSLVDTVIGDDFLLAQDYVPEAPEGDTRVILVDGEPLEVDGAVAAVRRVPQPGEFRSNVHLGATAQPAQLTAAQRTTLAAIAEPLRAAKLFIVGADLVGDQVIELNVNATGGLTDAGAFYERDFTAGLIGAVEGKVRQRRPRS